MAKTLPFSYANLLERKGILRSEDAARHLTTLFLVVLVRRILNQKTANCDMRETKKLTKLIGEIYDTALDRVAWTDVLGTINDFVGGQACGLFSKDSVSKCGKTHYYHGADPHYIQLYSETHSKFDPLSILPALGQVVSIPDLVSYDQYRHGRFYQEWLRPQGFADAANVVLENSKSKCPVLLTVLPGKARMVDEQMYRRISLIVPHLRRALLIGKAIDLKQLEKETFADTLDGLSSGIFFVDVSGRIVHANAAGHEMLRANDFLRSVGGRLVARNVQVNQTLRDVFAASGGFESGIKGIALALTAHHGERYVAHVLPLMPGERRDIGAAHKATAALFVLKASMESRLPADLIARTYQLTPTELRVLLAIIEGGGVPEAAEALGIAETTVKTHLHRIFSKTGAPRQADLVKLAAGFSNPLIG